MLGGRVEDVTLLFSDVADFTAIAERLAPDVLAEALGAYLETATAAVHASGGIVDKYTGDGVMALWNTPRPVADHARRACEAALACVAATDALFASPAWKGRAPWRTRFGIHRAEVTVGHFGAPDRMSFTAMGDGVNLASRLESLGKQYGTRILVSATVEAEARAAFWFRRVDRVAVKGRHMGVEIFELLGSRAGIGAPPSVVAPYERALDAYFARDFAGALATLETTAELVDDPPSHVLAARCRDYITDPPPSDWNGVHVAETK
jgi:adenylate cyclase